MTEHYNKNFKYIKNNHWKDDKPESRVHGYDLMVDDLRFKRHRPNKDSINYRCKTSGCTSSITIKAKKLLIGVIMIKKLSILNFQH